MEGVSTSYPLLKLLTALLFPVVMFAQSWTFSGTLGDETNYTNVNCSLSYASSFTSEAGTFDVYNVSAPTTTTGYILSPTVQITQSGTILGVKSNGQTITVRHDLPSYAQAQANIYGNNYGSGLTLIAPGEPPTTYKVSFALPTNSTDHSLQYSAMQSGSIVGSWTTAPGETAHIVTITDLSSNAIVTLTEYTEKISLVSTPGDPPTWAVVSSGGYARQVNGAQLP